MGGDGEGLLAPYGELCDAAALDLWHEHLEAVGFEDLHGRAGLALRVVVDAEAAGEVDHGLLAHRAMAAEPVVEGLSVKDGEVAPAVDAGDHLHAGP